MKEKIHFAIEAALGVAVVVLFILFFSKNSCASETKEVVSNEENAAEAISIAFIDIDTLMMNYAYSIDLNERITKEIENSRLKFADQYNKFQVEVQDYSRKAESGAFLSRERQESEMQRLNKKNEELQNLDAKYSQELELFRMRMTEALRQVIIAQLQEFNKSKGYHIIYGRIQDNILYAKDSYNVTADVVEYLNRHYTANPSLKPTN